MKKKRKSASELKPSRTRKPIAPGELAAIIKAVAPIYAKHGKSISAVILGDQ